MNYQSLKILMLAFYEPDRRIHRREVFLAAARDLTDGAGSSAECAVRMADALAGIDRDEKLQSLLIDYTRLFLNPSGSLACPYLSGWKTLLGKDVVERYLEFFHAHGFSVAPDFPDLPEHVAAVLETYLELTSCDRQGARELWNDILYVWLKAFAKQLSENAREDFYQAFGGFLLQWAEDENRGYKLS